MLVIRTALIALAATVAVAAARWPRANRLRAQAGADCRQPGPRRTRATSTSTPSSAPRGKLPDYAVAGSAPRDQVYVGTMFDNLGPTGMRR